MNVGSSIETVWEYVESISEEIAKDLGVTITPLIDDKYKSFIWNYLKAEKDLEFYENIAVAPLQIKAAEDTTKNDESTANSETMEIDHDNQKENDSMEVVTPQTPNKRKQPPKAAKKKAPPKKKAKSKPKAKKKKKKTTKKISAGNSDDDFDANSESEESSSEESDFQQDSSEEDSEEVESDVESEEYNSEVESAPKRIKPNPQKKKKTKSNSDVNIVHFF